MNTPKWIGTEKLSSPWERQHLPVFYSTLQELGQSSCKAHTWNSVPNPPKVSVGQLLPGGKKVNHHQLLPSSCDLGWYLRQQSTWLGWSQYASVSAKNFWKTNLVLEIISVSDSVHHVRAVADSASWSTIKNLPFFWISPSRQRQREHWQIADNWTPIQCQLQWKPMTKRSLVNATKPKSWHSLFSTMVAALTAWRP